MGRKLQECFICPQIITDPHSLPIGGLRVNGHRVYSRWWLVAMSGPRLNREGRLFANLGDQIPQPVGIDPIAEGMGDEASGAVVEHL